MRSFAAAAAFVVSTLPVLAQADDYWVAPTGLPGNSGSESQPFRQVRDALPLLGPGDTVHVADGSYLGFDVEDLHGSAALPITIRATGAAAVVTVTTDRGDNRDTIRVASSSYVVIDGFTGMDANRAGLRVDSSAHVTIRNCTFGDSGTWGIFTNQSDDLVLEGNECFGSIDEHGIYFSNSGDRPIIRNNRLHDNNANGLHMNGDIFTPPGDGIISGALVEGNIIWGNGAAGGSGINCDGVQDSIIRNNVLFANRASGINLYQIDGGEPSHRNAVYNNSIDQAVNGRWAMNVHDGSEDTLIFNNIFLTRHPSRGSLHFNGADNLVGLISDYNLLTTNTNVATRDDDSTFETFAEWQALGYDAHSLTAAQAVVWVDSLAGDLHLLDDSPALDAGIASLGGEAAAALDYEGGARPAGTGVDMGAHERGSVGGTDSGPLGGDGGPQGGDGSGGPSGGDPSSGVPEGGCDCRGAGGGAIAWIVAGLFSATGRRRTRRATRRGSPRTD